MNWYKLAIKKVADNQVVINRIKENIRKAWPDQGEEIINNMNDQDWNELIQEIDNSTGNSQNLKNFVETPLDPESKLGKIDQFFLNVQNKQFLGTFGKKVNTFLKNVDNILGEDLGVENIYGKPLR